MLENRTTMTPEENVDAVRLNNLITKGDGTADFILGAIAMAEFAEEHKKAAAEKTE